jgi:mRNA interferase RelE/StbE
MTKEFRVDYSKRARKALAKMDPFIRRSVLSWIDKNLDGYANPRKLGKGLASDRTGEWRYRVGDYRIIADIQDSKVLILVLTVGHRRDIYKQA